MRRGLVAPGSLRSRLRRSRYFSTLFCNRAVIFPPLKGGAVRTTPLRRLLQSVGGWGDCGLKHLYLHYFRSRSPWGKGPPAEWRAEVFSAFLSCPAASLRREAFPFHEARHVTVASDCRKLTAFAASARAGARNPPSGAADPPGYLPFPEVPCDTSGRLPDRDVWLPGSHRGLRAPRHGTFSDPPCGVRRS